MSRRRKLVWARSAGTIVLAAGSNDAVYNDLMAPFLIQMGLLQGPPGVTVMRIRLDTFSTNTDQSVGLTHGIRVTDRAEFIAASNTVADRVAISPAIDLHADWMMWRQLLPNHGSNVTTGVPNASTYEEDVRSMRKLDELGDTLIYGIGTTLSRTSAIAHSYAASVLLALP